MSKCADAYVYSDSGARLTQIQHGILCALAGGDALDADAIVAVVGVGKSSLGHPLQILISRDYIQPLGVQDRRRMWRILPAGVAWLAGEKRDAPVPMRKGGGFPSITADMKILERGDISVTPGEDDARMDVICPERGVIGWMSRGDVAALRDRGRLIPLSRGGFLVLPATDARAVSVYARDTAPPRPDEARALRAMWLGVISESFGGSGKRGALRKEAIAREAGWIGTPGFHAVCHLAGICPDYTRDALLREGAEQ